MTDAYRTNYGVSIRARDMAREERERVEREVRTWDDAVRRQAMATPNQARAIGLAALVAMIIALAMQSPAIAFSTGSLAAILLFSWFVSRKQARKVIASSRGPFHPPPEGWRIEEIDVRARSLVVAPSSDEDYMAWWLLEVPGGDWFYFESAMLTPNAARSPCEKLRIVRLSPDGPTLEAQWTGDPIPRRGMSDTDEAYAAAMDAGRVWRPTDDTHFTGVVAESLLPSWIRAEARDAP